MRRKMQPSFEHKLLKAFQFQEEAKLQKTRRSSESELDKLYDLRSGNRSQNINSRGTRTTRSRVAWNCSSSPSTNVWDSHQSSSCFGSDVGRTRSRHRRRVTFSDRSSAGSWMKSGFCIKHQIEEANRSLVTSRERDFCEVLGNQYCKSCRREGLRKECNDDFESTYIAAKSRQEVRSFTPLTDVVLCKSPAIPQSDSRGLFNRLHELSNCSPEYYINPVDGIVSCMEQSVSPSPSIHIITDSGLDVLGDACASNFASGLEKSEGGKELLQQKEDEKIHFEKDEHHEEKSSRNSAKKAPLSFDTVGKMALATTQGPIRKSNTFLPELDLKEVRAQMQNILSNGTKTSETSAGTFFRRRKVSFREMPIEPPRITVDFAMGIFDPKKRLLHKKVTYAAVDPNELSN